MPLSQTKIKKRSDQCEVGTAEWEKEKERQKGVKDKNRLGGGGLVCVKTVGETKKMQGMNLRKKKERPVST